MVSRRWSNPRECRTSSSTSPPHCGHCRRGGALHFSPVGRLRRCWTARECTLPCPRPTSRWFRIGSGLVLGEWNVLPGGLPRQLFDSLCNSAMSSSRWRILAVSSFRGRSARSCADEDEFLRSHCIEYGPTPQYFQLRLFAPSNAFSPPGRPEHASTSALSRFALPDQLQSKLNLARGRGRLVQRRRQPAAIGINLKTAVRLESSLGESACESALNTHSVLVVIERSRQ